MKKSVKIPDELVENLQSFGLVSRYSDEVSYDQLVEFTQRLIGACEKLVGLLRTMVNE